MSEKLQKILAGVGLGSRRELEKWIIDGRYLSMDPSQHLVIGLRPHRIMVDGRVVKTNQADTPRVLMYSKPEGEVCTTSDPDGRPTCLMHCQKLIRALDCYW